MMAHPDYLDPDSDNDGIFDLVKVNGEDSNSDGRVDSSVDIDWDGIPVSADVTYTGGPAINSNGIDDRMDAAILNDPDQDGDGIADAFDADINGDGFADNLFTVLSLGMALPDIDQNGVPDYLQRTFGTLQTGVGGCSHSDSVPPNYFMLLMLLLSIDRVTARTRKRPSTIRQL